MANKIERQKDVTSLPRKLLPYYKMSLFFIPTSSIDTTAVIFPDVHSLYALSNSFGKVMMGDQGVSL
jgi:hypothetical protein